MGNLSSFNLILTNPGLDLLSPLRHHLTMEVFQYIKIMRLKLWLNLLTEILKIMLVKGQIWRIKDLLTWSKTTRVKIKSSVKRFKNSRKSYPLSLTQYPLLINNHTLDPILQPSLRLPTQNLWIILLTPATVSPHLKFLLNVPTTFTSNQVAVENRTGNDFMLISLFLNY